MALAVVKRLCEHRPDSLRGGTEAEGAPQGPDGFAGALVVEHPLAHAEEDFGGGLALARELQGEAEHVLPVTHVAEADVGGAQQTETAADERSDVVGEGLPLGGPQIEGEGGGPGLEEGDDPLPIGGGGGLLGEGDVTELDRVLRLGGAVVELLVEMLAEDSVEALERVGLELAEAPPAQAAVPGFDDELVQLVAIEGRDEQEGDADVLADAVPVLEVVRRRGGGLGREQGGDEPLAEVAEGEPLGRERGDVVGLDEEFDRRLVAIVGIDRERRDAHAEDHREGEDTRADELAEGREVFDFGPDSFEPAIGPNRLEGEDESASHKTGHPRTGLRPLSRIAPFDANALADGNVSLRTPPMLNEEIRRRLTEAMKRGDSVEKDILRVALGEIQTQATRAGSVSEEEEIAIVRKLVKSNEETLAHTTDASRKETLERENTILRSLLPQELGVDQIVAALEEQREALRAAANDGQATGIAMKALKAKGATVNGKDVAVAVKQIRS